MNLVLNLLFRDSKYSNRLVKDVHKVLLSYEPLEQVNLSVEQVDLLQVHFFMENMYQHDFVLTIL